MNQVSRTKSLIKKTKVRQMSVQVAEVRQSINVIHEALQSVMKEDTHFGVIPGTKKPTLYKAGAEVIIALFKLTTDPIVTNLSENGEIRYQVKVNIKTREGVFIGSGIGECSSQEEKYMWKGVICEREFETTPETHRRIKFRKKWKSSEIEEIQQVRVNPSDLANTILKMAKKRALIDAVLTATGASDIFTQDIQDLPEGFIVGEEGEVPQSYTETPTKQENVEKKATQEPNKAQEEPVKEQKAGCISEAQRKRLFAIASKAGMTKDFFKEWLFFEYDYSSSKDIHWKDYEKICEAAQSWKGGEGA